VPVRDRPGQPHLSSCSHYKRLILHAAIAASAIGSYHDWDLTEAEAEPETGPFFGHGLYTKIDVTWSPRWNIAPSQMIPTVRQNATAPRRIFSLMRWGLISHGTKEPSIGLRTINAMSETAAEKPAFRDAFRFRRCLVPADGFYEWKKIGPKGKQPYNFGALDGSVFAFAGLWDRWRSPDNAVIESCAILTTPPNAVVAEVHDRMPAILSEADYDRWLDPCITDAEQVADCLRPFDPRLMKKYPVSNRVNRPENDDAVCAQEVPAENTSLSLF
jgi:putative SOS response-associated peptidase YedK